MRKKSHGMIDDLDNVDFISSNVHSSRQEAFVICFWRQRSSDQDDHKGEEALQWDMFPEPTELLLIGCLIESIWTPRSKSSTLTPKTNSQTYWQREISHVMNGIIFCGCPTSAILVPPSVLTWCRKERKKNAGEERVTAKSNPMMNLVSRCSVRDPNVLASTASESPGGAKSESQIPLSSWNEQQPRTERPLMGASSSDYSEWDIDEKWSSQGWKSGEMLGARTERPESGQPFTQHKDKFVIDHDDMDSDTATESNLSLKSRSFLHRVNDRVRKILDHSSKDAMQNIDKLSNLGNVYVFNIGSICIHGNELLGKFTVHQKYREQSHFGTDVWHIWKVDSRTIRWDFWSDSNQLGRFFMETIIFRSMMKKSSVSRMQRFMYFQILCYVLERWIRTQHQMLVGKKSWVGSWVHHNTELWTQLTESRWNWSGIFSKDSPHCSSSAKSKSSWPKWAIHHNSKDESSSCRCSMTSHGDLKTMNGNAMLTPHLCLYLQKDSQQDVGHFSDLDQKRSGILFILTDHKENGTESLNWWWSNSEKADTQFSEPRVHCPEERSKAKVVENYQYISVAMGIWLKLFSAQLFLLISSVSTEQSEIFVMNTVPVQQERWDPCWQDNLTHCSSQQVCWWHQLHLRPKILHKKIYCKSTKNAWKGSHNKTVWSKLYWCRIPWQQLKSDSTSWQRTLKSSHNLLTCREYTLPRDENHLTRKVGFEGTPKLGPCWKSQQLLAR